MATYKVIQDIEAEDKLLGPFSLRQCLYAAIVLALGFLMFQATIHGAPYFAVPMLPPAILFLVLAAPFGHDQSSEVWLLAKIRFHIKPRQRIWDQSGLQELVTVTAPKKAEETYTKGLNATQVESRLQALAKTIDTRGWAVKGVSVNLYTSPTYIEEGAASSDRLVDPAAIAPQPVADFTVNSTDDMLDTQNNRVAQQLDQLVHARSKAHRQAILEQMHQTSQATGAPPSTPPPLPAPAKPDRPQSYATFTPTTILPGPIPTTNDDQTVSPPSQDLDEQLLTAQFQNSVSRTQQRAYGNTRVLQPNRPGPTPPPAAKTSRKSPSDPAILGLASNDDLSVATIARQANQRHSRPRADDSQDEEVVVSLR